MKYNTERNNEHYGDARTLVEVEGLTAFAAAQKLGLNPRTVQDWARKDDWDKSAINARRRTKRARKRAASTERSAAPAVVHRQIAPASQPQRQAIQRREGWGAVIEHRQPSYFPASREMAEPDEYFDQSQQPVLYRNRNYPYADLAQRTVERLGYDGAIEYYQALGDELGVSAVRELEPEQDTRLNILARYTNAPQVAPARQSRQLMPAYTNSHHQYAPAPERKPFGQRFKEWLFGSPQETAPRPIPNQGFSPYNCHSCGSNRLQWGQCLDCGGYNLM